MNGLLPDVIELLKKRSKKKIRILLSKTNSAISITAKNMLAITKQFMNNNTGYSVALEPPLSFSVAHLI